VEYEIDETTFLATETFSYGPPSGDEQFFSPGQGDANMINTGTSVLMGTPAPKPNLSQISYPDGELIWKLEFLDDPSDEVGVLGFYRTTWLPSIYETNYHYQSE